MVEKNYPHVLKNTFATTWNALNGTTHWTPELLASKVAPELSNIYSNSVPLFGPLWRSNKPLAKAIPNLPRRNPHFNREMKSKTFFKRLLNPKAGEFLYYTGDLGLGSALLPDISPLDELCLSPGEQNIFVWIGQPSVTTHLHMDTYENFFVQVHGTKKFLLFPPSEHMNLYPFPFLHPSHAQVGLLL
jgi:hypothetical protein